MIADIMSSLIYDIYEFVKFATGNFKLWHNSFYTAYESLTNLKALPRTADVMLHAVLSVSACS